MFGTPTLRDIGILILVCSAVIWFRLGSLGLIDPDEPFYAQTAREMVASGDWNTPQIFGEPQFEKPIFYYWLTAASFKLFGENEFTARLPSAIAATVLVFMVYFFGSRFFGRRAGLLAALIFGTGIEFTIISRLMFTDGVYALFITGSLFSYWLALKDRPNRLRWIILHFACAGLAVLTKGPRGLIISLLATGSFSLLMRRPMLYRGRALWIGLATYAAVALPWYALMIHKFGSEYIEAFFIHENLDRLLVAEHPVFNYFYFYIIVLVLGSIPWMPLIVAAGLRAHRDITHDSRMTFLWCWIITSFVFLTAAQSKLPSYIFHVFVPCSLIIGSMLDRILAKGFRTLLKRRLIATLTFVQCLIPLGISLSESGKPFAIPLWGCSALLAIGFVFLCLGKPVPWITSNVCATIALIIGGLTITFTKVELFVSTRPVAEEMMRRRIGNEPLLAGKFAVRGIHYYTREPVTVISDRAQPFWTPHPLPVIFDSDGLREFLSEHPTALCTFRRKMWLHWKESSLMDQQPEWFGFNAVFRLKAPAPNSNVSAPIQPPQGGG